MKKRLMLSFLAAVLLVCALAPAAFADESVLEDRHIADGSCGEGLSWSLDGYTLTITGDGAMDDGCPWIEHMDHIEHVVLDGAITGGMPESRAMSFEDSGKLVTTLKLLTKPGDVILFKGSRGMRMELILEAFLAEET